MKSKIQIKSDKYNGEIHLLQIGWQLRGSWQQYLRQPVTSTNDKYLYFTFSPSNNELVLGEKMNDSPREELIVLSDYHFYVMGRTGTGFKRSHTYLSGQQLDGDIPLTWTHMGFI